jgi:hypothetical protein
MNAKFTAAHSARQYEIVVRSGLAMLGLVSLLASRLALAAYEIIPVPNGGTIDGYVRLSGDGPSEATIKVTKNQDYCGSYIADPTFTVDEAGGLGNVIVYLKDITKGKAADAALLSLVAEHCMLTPRAQGAMVGQYVKISSNDAILHNTHPVNAETNATIFNTALPFAGVSVTKPLPASPGLIKIKCDAQEWMHAWILELDHPYYATTNKRGHFTINDIPAGNYTVVAWHEAAGEMSEPIVVSAGQTTTSTMTLKAK